MPLSSSAAWKVEAEPPSQGVSFAEYREGLIHETTLITDFLDGARGEQFAISAPKGFGKTLLLFAKRKQLEELGGYRFSPGGELVERPDGSWPDLRIEELEEYRKDYTFWLRTWLVCIMLAAVKVDIRARTHHPVDERLEVVLRQLIGRLDGWSQSLLADPFTRNSPADIFVNFFAESYKTRLNILRGEGILNDICGTIKVQTAFFIDNVDEYFQKAHDNTIDERDDNVRQRNNDIWTLGQLGLIGAAYKLHKSNSHVKVVALQVEVQHFLEKMLHGQIVSTTES